MGVSFTMSWLIQAVGTILLIGCFGAVLIRVWFIDEPAQAHLGTLLPSLVLAQARQAGVEELRQVGTKPFDDDARQELTIEAGETLEATVEKGGLAVFQSPEGRQTLFYRVGPYWVTFREESLVAERVHGLPARGKLRLRDETPLRIRPLEGVDYTIPLKVPGANFALSVGYSVQLVLKASAPPAVTRGQIGLPETPVGPASPLAHDPECQAAAELADRLWRAMLEASPKDGS